MAFTANTAFEDRVTNSRFNDLANVAGKFGTVSDSVLTPADCSAGWLCTKDMALPVEGMSGVNNENTYAMVAATSSANAGDPIYACNTHEIQLLNDGIGNNYAIGHRTLGLGVPAGRYGAFTNIIFDGQHEYRFGVGNINNTLSTNTFFTIDGGQLKAQAAAPTTNGAIYFELKATGTFTEGASASFGYVDVVAKTVYAGS